jgi:hypothetical protein
MMNEMNPGTGGSVKKNKVKLRKSARPLVPLGHIERILEDVSHAVAGETGVAIRRS